jgi:N utilization substance protein B
MATYELMFVAEVPPKVAINEAIELGKKFSTANSGGFVNGILDRIRIDLEKERKGESTTPPTAP